MVWCGVVVVVMIVWYPPWDEECFDGVVEEGPLLRGMQVVEEVGVLEKLRKSLQKTQVDGWIGG